MIKISMSAIQRMMNSSGSKESYSKDQAISKKISSTPPADKANTPSDLKIPSFLMNWPFTLSIDNPNNVWMTKKGKKVELDKEKAFAQYAELYHFAASNAVVYILPSLGNFQDQVYVANLACYLPHIKNKETVLVSKMQSPPRRGEEDVGQIFFKLMNYDTYMAPLNWEGEAELKYLNDNNYILGYGERTDKEVGIWMKNNFGMNIINVEETDPHLYHLDCMVFPLSRKKLLACTDLIPPKTIKEIEKVIEIIPVTSQMAHDGVTNCVRIRNMILSASNINELKETSPEYKKERDKNEFLNKICSDDGLEHVSFNLSEFEKSGAALSCCFMHLNYIDQLEDNL